MPARDTILLNIFNSLFPTIFSFESRDDEANRLLEGIDFFANILRRRIVGWGVSIQIYCLIKFDFLLKLDVVNHAINHFPESLRCG